MRRSAPGRCRSPSASSATASGSATGWRRSPGTPARHLEAWYGILGIGAVYHTVNPRLFPEQIAWIINHAEDRVLLTDLTFLPLLEKLADRLATIERYVVLTDAAHLPATSLPNVVAYRGMDRRGRRRFRLEIVRREHRRRHVLHLRHHRQPQGRGLFAPLQRAAGDGDRLDGHVRDFVPRRGHAGGADVPRQRLVDRARGADDRREPGDAGRQARRRLDLRAADPLPRHLHGGGADRLARAAGSISKPKAAGSPTCSGS